MTNAEIIWKYFENKKFSPYAIAGIMGNLQAESRLLPNNLQDSYNRSLGLSDEEYTKRVDNGTYSNFIYDQAGYGLAQWTFWSLKEELYKLCKERGKSISDINCQLDCLYNQIQSHKLLGLLNSATSVREASDIFLTKFERPKNQGESVKSARANNGQQFYNEFANKKQQTVSVKGGNEKMKYSNSNQPLVCMQTNSTCYRGTSTMQVKGVLWHSTGANNTTIKRYVQPSDNDPNCAELLAKIGKNPYRNDWNHIATQAGLNAWIGTLADGSVAAVQTMPWNYKPWGCGSGSKGSCNNGWIQFEICEDSLSDKNYFEKVYKEACELTAYLCKMYNLNPKGMVSFNGANVPVILCHQDSYRLGLGSNHSDVYHWFNRYGKTMDSVREDVAALLGSSSGTVVTPTQQPAISKNRDLGKGDEGSDVKELQENLIALGYSCGPDGADGDFGNNTDIAVRKFQKDYNLVQDGIVGKNTKAAIATALKNKTSTPTTPAKKSYYRVRKSWTNAASQIGAFLDLNNAIAACKQAGNDFKVFDMSGKEIYSNPVEKQEDEIIAESEEKKEEEKPNITPKINYSGVVLGSSSKDERGLYRGGQAGDQTGKEVYTLNWYNGGWKYVIRPKTNALAEKIASACEQGCLNNNIGYNQYNRNSIYNEAKKVGLDLSKISTPCDCDCSSFVSTCCICAGLPENIFFAGGNMRITTNLLSACESTGEFMVLTTTTYTREKDYLKRGDILLADGHTVIVLSNGAKAENIAPIVTTYATYKVRIITNKLNVRAKPSTAAAINTQVAKNEVYTIVQEEGGWGKLKSGAGWIDLSYTERI